LVFCLVRRNEKGKRWPPRYLGGAPSPPVGCDELPEDELLPGPLMPPMAAPPSEGPLWAVEGSTPTLEAAGVTPLGELPDPVELTGGTEGVVGLGSQALNSTPSARQRPAACKR
jgi:hypothetical protein